MPLFIDNSICQRLPKYSKGAARCTAFCGALAAAVRPLLHLFQGVPSLGSPV